MRTASSVSAFPFQYDFQHDDIRGNIQLAKVIHIISSSFRVTTPSCALIDDADLAANHQKDIARRLWRFSRHLAHRPVHFSVVQVNLISRSNFFSIFWLKMCVWIGIMTGSYTVLAILFTCICSSLSSCEPLWRSSEIISLSMDWIASPCRQMRLWQNPLATISFIRIPAQSVSFFVV